MARVVILDYGSGNLRSAQRALARAVSAEAPWATPGAGAAPQVTSGELGACSPPPSPGSGSARPGAEDQVEVTADLAAAEAADGLVVPGVGAYAACMAGIEAIGAGPVIAERVAAGRPVLGICVGMQILFEYGDEHGVVTKGLGLLPGGVLRLSARRVPHMGWNTVDPPAQSRLFAGLPEGTRFYFVHSYAAHPSTVLSESSALVTVASHDKDFVAAVERGALAATQFHPEKSADAGALLLANWIGTL